MHMAKIGIMPTYSLIHSLSIGKFFHGHLFFLSSRVLGLLDTNPIVGIHRGSETGGLPPFRLSIKLDHFPCVYHSYHSSILPLHFKFSLSSYFQKVICITCSNSIGSITLNSVQFGNHGESQEDPRRAD